MLGKFKCKKCEMVFVVGLEIIEPGNPIRHCVCCGSKELEFLADIPDYLGPRLDQEDIRDVFAVGQRVLIRDGIDWRTREILGITVLRHDANCPHCNIPLLGEPRFWFKGVSNLTLNEIMAKEDIDPQPKPTPGVMLAIPTKKKD